MPEIKFCGMTRSADVETAVALGADYVGVVFAESPRRVSPSQAIETLGAATASAGTRRVGVFGPVASDEVVRIAREVGLDVVQLHGLSEPRGIERVRSGFAGEVWGVARVGAAGLGDAHRLLFQLTDGVVLDALSARGLGGTGEAFDWFAVAATLASVRGTARVIVAGGLHAGNVAAAIEALAPDVVDVSSGIERAPGIKDPERMRAFRDAARAGARR